jgi:hypothetical protein
MTTRTACEFTIDMTAVTMRVVVVNLFSLIKSRRNGQRRRSDWVKIWKMSLPKGRRAISLDVILLLLF